MANIKLGAISNFDERLGTCCVADENRSLVLCNVSDGILTGLGISSYFDFVLMSYKVGSAKPDPK